MYTTKHEILCKYQFGFRENNTTRLAIEIIENIRLLVYKQNICLLVYNEEIVIGVYIDLTKAFDTVQHDILLHKLQHYGIRSKALKWFHSYLSNRKQFVYANGIESNIQNINTRVSPPRLCLRTTAIFSIYQ